MKSSQQNPGSSAESRAAGRAPGNGSRRQAEQAESLAAALRSDATAPDASSRRGMAKVKWAVPAGSAWGIAAARKFAA